MPDPMTRSIRPPQPARITLPRNPSSVAAARRFIEARAAAWSFPKPAGELLVLIGSELVTNAVLHARTELTLTVESATSGSASASRTARRRRRPCATTGSTP
jgi:anti-sigma regulatory factor (Ser/Thr protein kinase)